MSKDMYIPGRKLPPLLSAGDTLTKRTQKLLNLPALPTLTPLLPSAAYPQWTYIEKSSVTRSSLPLRQLYFWTTLTDRKLPFVLRSKFVLIVSNMWQLASLQQYLQNKISLFLWCAYLWSLTGVWHTELPYLGIFSQSQAIPCEILLHLSHSFVNYFCLSISILDREVARCMEKYIWVTFLVNDNSLLLRSVIRFA